MREWSFFAADVHIKLLVRLWDCGSNKSCSFYHTYAEILILLAELGIMCGSSWIDQWKQ